MNAKSASLHIRMLVVWYLVENWMIRSKTNSAHWAELSVSAIVEMGTGCFGPKQFRPNGPNRPFLQSLKCGMLVLTWAQSSVSAVCAASYMGPIIRPDVWKYHIWPVLRLTIMCNFGIISASLFGNFFDLLRLAYSLQTLWLLFGKFGRCVLFNFGIIWLIFGKFCVSFHCIL